MKRKTHTRNPKPAGQHVPYALALFAEATHISSREQLAAAMPVALEMVADGTDFAMDYMEEAIKKMMAGGNYPQVHEWFQKDDFEKKAGVEGGDVYIAFTDPAFALGMATAYLLLTEGGTR